MEDKVFTPDSRWICPREVDLFASFAYRSPETLGRILTRLERAGLLRGTSRFNTRPGDRTKWYTIDFAALARLSVGVAPVADVATIGETDDLSRPKAAICPDPTAQDGPIQAADSTTPYRGESPKPGARSDQTHDHGLIVSLRGSETESQIAHDKKQHDPATRAAPTDGVVVAMYQRSLIERGITATVADMLARTSSRAVLERQLAVYDWLRGQAPDDTRLTPGRLRLMIEQDWVAPPGYRSPADLADDAAAASSATTARKAWATAQRDAFDRLGVAETDQALWARLVQQVPPLPQPFRAAIFHAPEGRNGAAAVIFPDATVLARATGPAHASTRATIAARVATLCQQPGIQLHYLDLPDLCAQLGVDAVATVAALAR